MGMRGCVSSFWSSAAEGLCSRVGLKSSFREACRLGLSTTPPPTGKLPKPGGLGLRGRRRWRCSLGPRAIFGLDRPQRIVGDSRLAGACEFATDVFLCRGLRLPCRQQGSRFMRTNPGGRDQLALPCWLGAVGLTMGLWACGDPATTGAACDVGPGDLVISEIMPNPDGDEQSLEWIEIYNAAGDERLLDRMVISVAGSGDAKTHSLLGGGHTLAAGAYFVMGNGPVSLPYVDYSYGSLSLNNEGGTVALSCAGKVVDEAKYGVNAGVGAPTAAHSLSFDGSATPSASLNDEPGYWCDGASPYDATNFGTPGATNDACGLAGCQDGNSTRDPVDPKPGELVLSELFANAVGADTDKEWLELYVAADHAVDLNGIELEVATVGSTTSPKTYRVLSQACVQAAPGDYVVLGAVKDPLLNGGVPVDLELPGLTFANSSEIDVAVRLRGSLIDSARFPVSEEGSSQRLDDGKRSATANDDIEVYCTAAPEQTGYFEGVGTPGEPNDLCGTVTCRDGASVRDTRRPDAGRLVITELYVNPPGGDNWRDWLEVWVTAGQGFDLNGLWLRSHSTSSSSASDWQVKSTTCLTVAPESYAVIAGTGAAAEGVKPAAEISEGSSGMFVSSSEQVMRIESGSTLIDEVTYPAQSSEGKSWQLTAGVLTASDNDTAKWCAATTASNGFTGGNGSPGADNEACP